MKSICKKLTNIFEKNGWKTKLEGEKIIFCKSQKWKEETVVKLFPKFGGFDVNFMTGENSKIEKSYDYSNYEEILETAEEVYELHRKVQEWVTARHKRKLSVISQDN